MQKLPNGLVPMVNLPGTGSILHRTWHVYSTYFAQCCGFSALFIVGLVVSGAVAVLIRPFVQSEDVALHVTAHIGTSVLNALTTYYFSFVFAGLVVFLDEVRRGGRLTVMGALERARDHVNSLFLILIIFVLTLYGSLFTGILFVLFFIWYTFSLYISIIGKERGINALLKSRYLTIGLFWKVTGRYYALIAILIGLYMLAYSTLGITSIGAYTFLVIGSIIAFLSVPFYIIYDFIRYIDLDIVQRTVEFHPYRGDRVAIIAWSIFGALIFLIPWSFGFLTIKAQAQAERSLALWSARALLPYVATVKTNLTVVRDLIGVPEIESPTTKLLNQETTSPE